LGLAVAADVVTALRLAHHAFRAADILARTLADMVRFFGPAGAGAGALGGAAPSKEASSFSNASICSLMARAWRSWVTDRLVSEFTALV
jgi:hypothetical protein